MLESKLVLATMALVGGMVGAEENRFAAKPPSNLPYLWAILGVLLIGAVMVFGIIVARPTADVMLVIAGVSAVVAPTLLALLGLLKTIETHDLVNSRSEQTTKLIEKIAFAQGLAEGRIPVVTFAPAVVSVAGPPGPSVPPVVAPVVAPIVAPGLPGLGVDLKPGETVIKDGDTVVMKKAKERESKEREAKERES